MPYDNERRRMESWLGDFMRFRQTGDGKNVFLSVDSRAIPGNPLYNAFKAKSFTSGDVTFHFYILDILQDGVSYTVQEIVDLMWSNYLSHFENGWQPDIYPWQNTAASFRYLPAGMKKFLKICSISGHGEKSSV